MRREYRRQIRWSKTQKEVLQFRAPPAADGSPQVEMVGILGEYGGGKTYVAARRFLQVCADNPSRDPAEPLMSGISAPTFTGLMNGPIAALLRLCPQGWIKRDRTRDTRDPHIVLRNNHKIILYTGRGALDGPNLVQFWADEIQDKSYEGQWANMAGRVRDIEGRRLNAQASGIAQEGYVAQLFRNPPQDGLHLTKLLFPEENSSNLAHGYVDMLKAASVGGRHRDPDGWMTPDGLFYPSFCRERNIDPVRVPRDQLRSNPTDISIDLGNRAAVGWWQPWMVECNYGSLGAKREPGQLLVDQWMPDNLDAEELAKQIRSTCEMPGDPPSDRPRWKIEPNVSTIALDPTAEVDQVRWFTSLFPNVRIVMAVDKTFYWFQENGERAVARAVLDAHGSVRFFVHPDLINDPSIRGASEAMRGYRRDKPKDKVLEHAADMVRYQIQHRLPLPNVKQVVKGLSLGSDNLRGNTWWKEQG